MDKITFYLKWLNTNITNEFKFENIFYTRLLFDISRGYFKLLLPHSTNNIFTLTTKYFPVNIKTKTLEKITLESK